MRLTFLLWILFGGLAAWAQNVQIINFDEGTGPQAQIGDRVAISYTLKLASGDIVEVTPAEEGFRFTLGGKETIPGMTQAVLGMRRGGSRRAIIPPELAYGDKGAGPIPPGASLYFDIRLDYMVTESGDLPDAKNPLSQKFGKMATKTGQTPSTWTMLFWSAKEVKDKESMLRALDVISGLRPDDQLWKDERARLN